MKAKTFATECIKCAKDFKRERNGSLVCPACRAKKAEPEKQQN